MILERPISGERKTGDLLGLKLCLASVTDVEASLVSSILCIATYMAPFY